MSFILFSNFLNFTFLCIYILFFNNAIFVLDCFISFLFLVRFTYYRFLSFLRCEHLLHERLIFNLRFNIIFNLTCRSLLFERSLRLFHLFKSQYPVTVKPILLLYFFNKRIRRLIQFFRMPFKIWYHVFFVC